MDLFKMSSSGSLLPDWIHQANAETCNMDCCGLHFCWITLVQCDKLMLAAVISANRTSSHKALRTLPQACQLGIEHRNLGT